MRSAGRSSSTSWRWCARTTSTLVLLENVRNLAGPRHVHEWEVIIELLKAEDYQVSETSAVFSPLTATLVPEGHVADPHVQPVALPPKVRMTREWNLVDDLPLDPSHHVPGTDLGPDDFKWINRWNEWVQFMHALRASDADAAGSPHAACPASRSGRTPG